VELTVRIEAPELTHAILELASVLAMGVSAEAAKVSLAHERAISEATAQTTSAPSPQPTAAPATASAAAAAATQPAAPTAPAAPTPPPAPSTAVPTAAPTYTLEQLAVAATQLVDAGRRDELIQLLQSFGAQALTALAPEHYGAFATKLREMGAKL